MTVAEMARMGGRARAAKYSTEQLREFAKGAGRPAKLDGRARRKLRHLLAAGQESGGLRGRAAGLDPHHRAGSCQRCTEWEAPNTASIAGPQRLISFHNSNPSYRVPASLPRLTASISAI